MHWLGGLLLQFFLTKIIFLLYNWLHRLVQLVSAIVVVAGFLVSIVHLGLLLDFRLLVLNSRNQAEALLRLVLVVVYEELSYASTYSEVINCVDESSV